MEIKKIDSDAVIGTVLTDNGKAYSCRTKKGREKHIFEKTCREPGIKHKTTRIGRPQTNGKVEYTHYLYDKEFYNRYKLLSFQDREKRLEEFTHYINYIKPNMAIGGITAYEKLLKVKDQKHLLTKEGNNDDISSQTTKERKEVAVKKFVA
jgi:transposase InsO family protein